MTIRTLIERPKQTVAAKTDPRIRGGVYGQDRVDVIALRRALRDAISGEVRFDPGSKAMYASDASNFRQVPIGVVIPKTLDDVVVAHRICCQFGAPIVNRGGGTSLSGETVNVAVVIDHSKYAVAAVRTRAADLRQRAGHGDSDLSRRPVLGGL